MFAALLTSWDAGSGVDKWAVHPYKAKRLLL